MQHTHWSQNFHIFVIFWMISSVALFCHLITDSLCKTTTKKNMLRKEREKGRSVLQGTLWSPWLSHICAKDDHLGVSYIEDILPKVPYPTCLGMADRALLAGYPPYARDRHITHWSQSKIAIIFADGIFKLILKETYFKLIQISLKVVSMRQMNMSLHWFN